MKWIEKVIINKASKLPWLEIHTGEVRSSTDNQEFSSYMENDSGDQYQTSLSEVMSIYNNDLSFEEESSYNANSGTNLSEMSEFQPLSQIDNIDKFPNSDLNTNDDLKASLNAEENYSFKPFAREEEKEECLNEYSFSDKYEEMVDTDLPSTYEKKPEISKNDFFTKTNYSFSLQNNNSSPSFTMEVDLNQTSEKYTSEDISRSNQDKIKTNEQLREFSLKPNEDLLMAPLTASGYEEDMDEEINDDFFEEMKIKENPVSIPKTPIRMANEENEKEQQKNNFRCSITPDVLTQKQFNIPFHILHTGEEEYDHSDPVEVQNVIEKLESTLEQFGIEARVIGMQKGPIITRYEIRIPPGIKVNRILGLTDELAMALEALRVRIEAPIPGRSTVGIEIPNKKRSTVLLGDVLNHDDYHPENVRLPLPLGKDIAGNNIIEDLTKMPHILIAGATGSGKSVAINSIITSMIISKSPEDVRLLMVDPKLVELSQYNDIPHLLHPVIADPQKAVLGLNWAVEEMERRYEDMADMRARDIVTYNIKVEQHNKKIKSNEEMMPKMPYIVILIDELGDLMMVAGKEVESSIIRLSQKARAIGIHLILATQRPSVDVITALIKANCPARIALQVAQKTDSRTILDSNGGEQLLGQGDMLFKHPSKAQLIRAQAPYVSDQEVENVVHTVKELGKPSYIVLEDPKLKSSELDLEDEDLFDEAWQIIIESNKASASYLQRRLRIGYNRAARLIEAFEARGYIGPQVGSKPREILMPG